MTLPNGSTFIGDGVVAAPIPGRPPEYMVTRDGVVYSLKFGKTRRLKSHFTSSGHEFVRTSHENFKTKLYVHQAVLLAWIGPRPDGMEACHNDGNHKNNTVENLRWDTRSANRLDAIKHGTHHWLKANGGHMHT